jgi:hypothetical protein
VPVSYRGAKPESRVRVSEMVAGPSHFALHHYTAFSSNPMLQYHLTHQRAYLTTGCA